MRLTRLVATAATSALLLGVAACGGDTAEGETAAAGSAAPSTGAHAASEDPSTDASADPDPSSSAGADDADGSDGSGYDAEELLAAMKAAVLDKESSHLTMDMSGGGQPRTTAEGDVSYEGDTTSMQLTMELPQAGADKVEMRLVDGILYMAMPPMTPKGKFLEIDTTDPNSPMGDLGGITQGDPLSTFKAFDAGLQKVRYVGEESVAGEDLDHYLLTVDAKKAAAAQGAGAEAMPPGTTTIDYDLWLDSEDLMRRMEFSQGAGSIVMTMSDWGKPVTVKAPPASSLMQLPGTR
ncbi:LppX_LprAFG lipoprotein [Nocardioides mesophilus]|uniref:LppX_LprAFG lipoprotein n=1 Tax=Nocardioides mesophilus TaxID=433659 RepID=A0A7G9RC89_9ACTN|nr:LppX_LprAFG lipoprotein [Nocardioides mesophilus]QNN53214.1 LppX_LprAFG lipoprotein [Nocardioides mesophilus]